LIVDEGPLGILSTPGLGRSEEESFAFVTTTNLLLNKLDGIVVLRASSLCCVDQVDEDHQHYSGNNNEGFPAHLHLSPSSPEKGGSAQHYQMYFNNHVSPLADLYSPSGEQFVAKYYDYAACTEQENSEPLKTLFKKLEDIGYPYLIKVGNSIYFKNKLSISENLTCPYSQCHETFVYKPLNLTNTI
jgi:hypothetical protein